MDVADADARIDRAGLLVKARNAWDQGAKPFGDQEIVWMDKVIHTRNKRMKAWPPDAGHLNYVANGEIGLVVRTNKDPSCLDVA